MGRALYEALADRLQAMGILNLYACIGYPQAEDEYLTRNSARFHEHLGFALVGTFHNGSFITFDAANWRYWVLPVCSMSLANLAFYAMWLRRYMVDESNKDYVKLARAKGVSESNIALHHVFRNAMVPLVQYIPSAFLNTVVGSIYIESLYSIPGMGGLLVTCVQRHDNTMVQGIVLLYACVGIVGLILGDVLMVLIDPRINFGKKEGGR